MTNTIVKNINYRKHNANVQRDRGSKNIVGGSSWKLWTVAIRLIRECSWRLHAITIHYHIIIIMIVIIVFREILFTTGVN